MFTIPPPLSDQVAEAEAAVGLRSGGVARELRVWSKLGNTDEVATYTIPDEYIQMTNARGWLAVVARWANTCNATELSHWLVATVDQLDDIYFAVTVPDRDHHSWAVSNYDASWTRRLPRNDLLAEAFRLHAPVMTASREHRVVCSGGITSLDTESQYAALDAITGTTSMRELLESWGQSTTQTPLDTQTLDEAVAVRTRIASYLALADQHGYVELINQVVDTLDEHDDTFRSRTSPPTGIDNKANVDLAQWWTRRSLGSQGELPSLRNIST